MNREQRRRAEHARKRNPKNKDAKALTERSRFETDLRGALALEGISLVRSEPGQEQDAATGKPTGATFWVFTVHASGRFISVKSPRGTLADVATGVVSVVREVLEKGVSTGLDVERAAEVTVGDPPKRVVVSPNLVPDELPDPRVQPAATDGPRGGFAAHEPGSQPPSIDGPLSLEERIRRAQAVVR